MTASTHPISRRGFLPLALACLGGLSTAALAQTWPDRPIRIVAPYAPGAAADQLARAVGARLATSLGQPVLVDNRAGAGGTLGADNVAKSAPDGYSIVLGSDASHAANVFLTKKFPYDPVKSFRPIAPAAINHIVLLVHPSLPIKSVAELIAYAKANPGKLSYGSSGPGSAHHLAGELLNEKAGIQTVHVPYKGGGPAMADLLANTLPMLFASMATASTGYFPMADSPESITQSVPSKIALATSVDSARVGRRLPVIDSSICVAVMTGLPLRLAFSIRSFCKTAICSMGISTPRSPRAIMIPSVTSRISSILFKALNRSILATMNGW